MIDNENFAYVHHMLVYICARLNETEVNHSAPCNGEVGASLSECLDGELITAWAVGGGVSNDHNPFIKHLHENCDDNLQSF